MKNGDNTPVADHFSAADTIDGNEGKTSLSLLPVAKPALYYWIFFVSGFAGIIYQSLWARYLKLFLGHAAYAQTVVLIVFLSGLAIGSALCARWSLRLSRPLLWYIVVEVIVAVIAVYFHELFVVAQGWGIDNVLPQIESNAAAEWFKFGLAGVLIFPQSVLLGATFPLMSAGLLRIYPHSPGNTIGLLYFSNSIGAAIGVLFGGFVLLPMAGLPGGVAFAGLLNAAAAAAVWILGHRYDDTRAPLPACVSAQYSSGSYKLSRLILVAAFVTGVGSFIYEIIWIRMLSLLLGSSLHNFEIMLSAFITGLAIGGWIVRRYADGSVDPLRLLGNIQVVMGIFALWSLFAFPLFYEVLNDTIPRIPKDDDGYTLFISLGLALSFIMMLPATICAGMTLPLLTRRLFAAGGEAAVGKVYAANTVGAVVGVILALHILLPRAGIQFSLLIGALLDMGLGVVLLSFVARQRVVAAFAVTITALIVAILFGGINLPIAAAGVYRHQGGDLPQVVFYRDGKTASIAVTESTNDGKIVRSIRTNGKTDAALFQKDFSEVSAFTRDEMTMTMLGLLPLLYKPRAKTAMNIGFGSGLTSRILLLNRDLHRLDNVEIEPVMVEGARQLGTRVAPVLDDSRNTFIFNDAKAVLARKRGEELYDIIVSEPSNPWVSGIAGLFTKEFYQRIRSGLAADGVFVQWLPLYEMEAQLISSVVQALAEVFPDFKLYLSSKADLIIIATPAESLPALSNAIFAQDEMRMFLRHYQYSSVTDIELVALGEGKIFLPYFLSYKAPTNSDYYPFLENNAPRAFFKKWVYTFPVIFTLPVPFMEALGKPHSTVVGSRLGINYSPLSQRAALARDAYVNREAPNGRLRIWLGNLGKMTCPTAAKPSDTEYLQAISLIVSRLMPMLNKSEMAAVWRILETDDCLRSLLTEGRSDHTPDKVYVRFWRALSLRDAATVIETGEQLIQVNAQSTAAVDLSTETGQIVLLSLMTAYYQQGNYEKVLLLLQELPLVNPVFQHAARLLSANAAKHL